MAKDEEMAVITRIMKVLDGFEPYQKERILNYVHSRVTEARVTAFNATAAGNKEPEIGKD